MRLATCRTPQVCDAEPATQFVNDIDMWRDYDAPTVERDLSIAAGLGFNFARVFLNFAVWDAQRDAFLQNVAHFLRTAHAHGISVKREPSPHSPDPARRAC